MQDDIKPAVTDERTVMSEFDSSEAVFKSRANKLASLLAAGEEGSRLWQRDELAAIFRHQMAAPIMVDLGTFDLATAARLKILSEAQGLLLKSFGDLFHHPTPPVELLNMIKDFAKLNRDHPASGLPQEIASTLYYASIAAALVRLNPRITQLPDADLRRGLLWILEQGWLDTATRELLTSALEKIPSKNPAS
jgi:hypothetical protein